MAAHPSLENKSDAELLRRARRDSAAFRVLYDRHAGRDHRSRSGGEKPIGTVGAR